MNFELGKVKDISFARSFKSNLSLVFNSSSVNKSVIEKVTDFKNNVGI